MRLSGSDKFFGLIELNKEFKALICWSADNILVTTWPSPLSA